MKDAVKENSLLLNYLIILSQCIRTDIKYLGFPVGDTGSVPGLGRSPGEEYGSPLQYLCLGNPMGRGASWTVVRGVRKESDMTYWLNNNNMGWMLDHFIGVYGAFTLCFCSR